MTSAILSGAHRLYQALMIRMKFAAQFAVDSLLLLIRRHRNPSRVLIVRLDGIGDFVLWLDAARAIVGFYKGQGKTVILVTHTLWADWARELGIFDGVLTLDRRRFDSDLFYRFRFGYRLRMLGCSIVVNPTYSREWLFGDALVRVCGARERIGSVGDLSNIAGWQRDLSNRAYTRLVPAESSPCMELVRNAEFVRGLGIVDYRAKVADLRAICRLTFDDAFVAALGSDLHYYVFFPGSNVPGKKWPLRNFAELADRIHKQTGWRGVICGGPDDAGLGDALCSQSNAPLLNWAGRTDLMQLTAVLSRSSLLVANDTAATHIAAACGVPSACIVGGGHVGRFLPYEAEQMDERPFPRAVTHHMPCFGCYWRCIYGMDHANAHPCIERITVSDVWREVIEILNRIPPKALHASTLPLSDKLILS